jgi:hypothetical protein
VAVLDVNLREEAAYPIADKLIEQRIPFVFATGYVGGEGLPSVGAKGISTRSAPCGRFVTCKCFIIGGIFDDPPIQST